MAAMKSRMSASVWKRPKKERGELSMGLARLF
jgi:hypothetical protein